MKPRKTRLNKFINSIESFSSFRDSVKVLILSYFFIEILKKPQITTVDLKNLYEAANLILPSNFGGEIKSLLKSKQLTKTKEGYKLNVRAKEWVKSQISIPTASPVIKNKSASYVNSQRIKELMSIKNDNFDLSRLLELCRELNLAFQTESYLSVPVLVRAVIDHIPPVFGLNNFSEVANNSGSKSFKESMKNMDVSSRKIGDSFLHTQIRSKEVLPNSTQVDFSNDLDILLSEVYRILK